MAAVNRNRSLEGCRGYRGGEVLEVAALPSEGSMSKRQTRQMVNKLSEKGKKQVKKERGGREGEEPNKSRIVVSFSRPFFPPFLLSYLPPQGGIMTGDDLVSLDAISVRR